MAKKVVGFIKLQIPGGKANPSPPIGPALGQKGVNIMEFCKAFNAKTNKQMGVQLPTIITVYSDRSFSFVTKTPPASYLLREKLKLKKVFVANQSYQLIIADYFRRRLIGSNSRIELDFPAKREA